MFGRLQNAANIHVLFDAPTTATPTPKGKIRTRPTRNFKAPRLFPHLWIRGGLPCVLSAWPYLPYNGRLPAPISLPTSAPRRGLTYSIFLRMKDLSNKLIVVTGASSGIGRATALLAAQQHATVVLISRQGKALRELAEECGQAGGRGIAAPADVTDPDALRTIAKSAHRQFGHIDAWINNAAVTLFAKFEVAPVEDYRRVIETNLYGYFHGAKAVLPFFRQQGSGVLINVSSMVGRVGAPYLSAYVATKFAINGWSESLRMELQDEPGIHVCTVLPASIDTPLFQHAANYTGRAIKPLPPVYPAELVAEAILGCIQRPQPEIYAGKTGALWAGLRLTSTRAAEKVIARQVETEHFQDTPADPTDGNLFAPMAEFNSVGGGWRERELSLPPKRGKFAWAGAATVAGLGAAAGYFWRRNSRQREETMHRAEEKIAETSERLRDRGENLMKPFRE